MPKEGSHLDLPIALALLAALNIITNEDSEGALAIGELSLDGRLQPVVGALPAALKAAGWAKIYIAPKHRGRGRMGGCHTGFCDKIPDGDHSTPDRSGTARTAVARQIAPQNLCWTWQRCADKNAQNAQIAAAGRHHVF